MFKEAERIRRLEESEEAADTRALHAAEAMFKEAERIRRLEESEEAAETRALLAA